MHRLLSATSLLALALGALTALPARAQTLTKQLVLNLPQVLYVCSPPGDTTRLFVVQKTGTIRIIKNGTLLSTPYLTVSVSGGSEQGLLGMAFHPNYATNKHFFLNYTNPAGSTVIARYTETTTDVADPASLVILKTIAQPQSNHNGGCIQFGPDGRLYVGMGDGGGANDSGTGHATGGNGQSGTTLLGKMLRLDVDNPPTYVPADNPYVNDPNVLDEIWHFGTRNPWRFSFDRLTGEMYIGDVGQDAREEISYQPAGLGAQNYGWRCMEGFNCTGLSGCTCNAANLRLPIHDYSHVSGCNSVTGGYVYRGCGIPGLQGTYMFADYCRRQVWTFNYNGTSISNFQERTNEIVNTGGAVTSIASFGEDARGELYLCDLSGGRLYRIVPATGSVDCNNNGVLDACDIAEGTSQDLNGNGVPDECECNPPPVAYCTAKVTSSGCVPSIGFVGNASLSNPGGFAIRASNLEPNQNGIHFFGTTGPDSTPFQDGTLCVLSPLYRLNVSNSGGGAACSGLLAYTLQDVLDQPQGGILVIAGQVVNQQAWFRDPPAASTTGLSNGLQYAVCP
jgi:glucose/arabinose dehydrogenase